VVTPSSGLLGRNTQPRLVTGDWQQVEAGRPITVTTLLRICEVFETPMSKLVRGLDKEGVYEALDVEIPPRWRGRPKR
jgi:hypothetical protein